MAKILLAWEYGSGLGHVAMLVPLALKLREAGHDPVLMLRDIKTAAHLWKDTNLTVLQAPYIRLPQTWDKTIRTDTLADVFQLGGLIDAGKLTALGKVWQKILADLKPDLVIGEFAPTLAMVTLGVIPTFTIGTGFSMPPAGRTLPSIRFWDSTISTASQQHEQSLDIALNTTRKALNLPPLAFFADLFGGERSFVCVLPELDCYNAYRTEMPIGPLTATQLPTFTAKKADSSTTQGFIYLNGEDENLHTILQHIHDSNIKCDGYIRSLDHSTLPENTNIHFYNTPQPLTTILPKRTVLIHHGGMSTSDIALRLGIPQLVLSRHLEQKTNGALLMRAGVAELVMAHLGSDISRLPDILNTMAHNEKLHQKAQQKALSIAARPSRPAVDIVTEACCALFG